MALVVAGLLNKQIGGELGISEITVKAHRGKVMQKMKADSLPDLVKMDARLRLAPAPKGGHSSDGRSPLLLSRPFLSTPSRNHHYPGNELITPDTHPARDTHVCCRERLGGLLRYSHRAA
jgi:hypothetical protein